MGSVDFNESLSEDGLVSRGTSGGVGWGDGTTDEGGVDGIDGDSVRSGRDGTSVVDVGDCRGDVRDCCADEGSLGVQIGNGLDEPSGLTHEVPNLGATGAHNVGGKELDEDWSSVGILPGVWDGTYSSMVLTTRTGDLTDQLGVFGVAFYGAGLETVKVTGELGGIVVGESLELNDSSA